MKKFLFFCCTFLLMYSWCFAGKTEAFFAAVRNGNSSQVERMLEKDKTLVFLKDRNGMTPFLLAVQTRNLKMTDLLSEYFARLNDSAVMGNAVHIAVLNEDEPMIRLILRLASEEDTEMPAYLLNMPRKQAGVKSAVANDKNTPLHLAAQKCNFRIYQYLLNNGANDSVLNAAGKTPKQIISACPKPQTKEKASVVEKPKKGIPRSQNAPSAAAEEPLVFPIQ